MFFFVSMSLLLYFLMFLTNIFLRKKFLYEEFSTENYNNFLKEKNIKLAEDLKIKDSSSDTIKKEKIIM
jgi:hypothetical protein